MSVPRKKMRLQHFNIVDNIWTDTNYKSPEDPVRFPQHTVTPAAYSRKHSDMFALTALLAVASATLPKALAHGGVLAYSNGGNWFQGW